MFLFGAFSSRERVAASLENALGHNPAVNDRRETTGAHTVERMPKQNASCWRCFV
jgi:hypothetical protein